MSANSTNSSTATPTSISSCNSTNATGNGTEDIQYLLYLETLRRFRDDELNIKRQVEEKTRQYLEVKEEYLQLYAKYVKLTTLTATRCALLKARHLPSDSNLITAAGNEIDAIAQKLATCDVIESIDDIAVNDCKTKLEASATHEKLKQLRQELAESKSTVRAVQTATETIENTIETATLQSLDFFVDEVAQRD